jgi:putative membrane fusion protein
MRKRREFTVIRGQGKKKQSPETIFYGFLVILAVALVLHTAYKLARDALTGLLVRTVISEDTVLEQSISTRGVIIRDEQPVAAPVTGKVHWVAKAGERLSLGSRAAVITPENGSPRNIYVPVPGVIITDLDGLEGMFSPKDLREVEMKTVLQLKEKTHRIREGEEVRQGSMLFKIVNNYSWFFVAELSLPEAEALRERKSVSVRFQMAPGEEANAVWTLLKEDDERVLAAFEIKDEVKGCFTQRVTEAEIIIRRTRGLVLPESALVQRGEDTGVYILDKAVVRYRRVDVLEMSGDNVVVGGIPHGFTVITNPGLVKEGQRL